MLLSADTLLASLSFVCSNFRRQECISFGSKKTSPSQGLKQKALGTVAQMRQILSNYKIKSDNLYDRQFQEQRTIINQSPEERTALFGRHVAEHNRLATETMNDFNG